MRTLHRTASFLVLLASLAALVIGCVVEERTPARPCAGGVWVPRHRGPRGAWHPGHWRCAGVVEVVEVD